ncbi:hypothetical protein BDV11DRAFT_105836 [Aspergillus similis]
MGREERSERGGIRAHTNEWWHSPPRTSEAPGIQSASFLACSCFLGSCVWSHNGKGRLGSGLWHLDRPEPWDVSGGGWIRGCHLVCYFSSGHSPDDQKTKDRGRSDESHCSLWLCKCRCCGRLIVHS